ncbi:response regulator [Alteromonas sp. ASW11-19]|uniref:Response regulator n=1 Tax=Alteromonas salexigens TaxID=2982530 RepID=A0ABT2VQA3_9ALTE|nr:response regulator [Alteromonas salexigens]MCU7555486.1 response regulator [Alteromonas salexigens]
MSFNVLICDDSALARKMAARSLPEGFAEKVFQAEDGAQALTMLRQQRMDLMLLDLTMPNVDGIDVLNAIKAQGIEVFVVVVSGDIQPQMRTRVMQLGALDFLAKPISKASLQAVLERYGFILTEALAG